MSFNLWQYMIVYDIMRIIYKICYYIHNNSDVMSIIVIMGIRLIMLTVAVGVKLGPQQWEQPWSTIQAQPRFMGASETRKHTHTNKCIIYTHCVKTHYTGGTLIPTEHICFYRLNADEHNFQESWRWGFVCTLISHVYPLGVECVLEHHSCVDACVRWTDVRKLDNMCMFERGFPRLGPLPGCCHS